MEILKYIPVMSLTVGTVGLLFSVIVLYPWHLELSQQFLDMRNACSIKDHAS